MRRSIDYPGSFTGGSTRLCLDRDPFAQCMPRYDYRNFFEMISTHKTLKHLDISNLNDKKKWQYHPIHGLTQHLAEALKYNSSIQEISISNNDLNVDKYFAEILKVNKTITYLNLSNNRIDDAGTQILAEVLKTNSSLTTILLMFNKIGDKGAQALADMLKVNKTITNIRLFGNDFSNQSLEAISLALKENTTIQSLELSIIMEDNNTTGIKTLSEMLQINQFLTNIYLDINAISRELAHALAEGLKTNNTLTDFYLKNGQSDYEVNKIIVNSLEINNNIISWRIYDGNDYDDEKNKEIKKTLVKANSFIAKGNKILISDPKQALLEYEQAVRLIPNKKLNVSFCKNIVECYVQLKQYGNAIEYYKQLLSLVPQERESINEKLTNCYKNNYQYKEALFCADEVLKLNPENVKINQIKVELLILHSDKCGRYDLYNKLGYLQHALSISNNYMETVINDKISETLKALNQSDQSLENIIQKHHQEFEQKYEAQQRTIQSQNNEIQNLLYKQQEYERKKQNKIIAKQQQEEAQKLLKQENEQKKLAAKQKIKIEEKIPEYKVVIKPSLSNIFPISDNNLQDNFSEKIIEINALMREGNDRLQGYNQKSILLLGNTGSGKSTLAHFMIGMGMQAIFDEEAGEFIIDAMQPLREIIISNKNTSETKIPNKCQLDDLIIWDCPGFNDTDVAQEIANAFYIKKLLETSRQLKFVLVVEDTQITGTRGTSFVATISQMVKYFNNIDALNCSVALVVTKVSNGKQVQHVLNSIDRILNQNEHIEPNVGQMIVSLKKSVQLVYKPFKPGEIDSQNNMLETISGSTEYYDSDKTPANMSVSREAIEYSEKLLQQVSHNFNKLIGIITLAVAHPDYCVDMNDENNVFVQNYELIKNWVPHSLQRVQLNLITFDGHFHNLDQLKSLQSVLKSYDNISSYNDAITTLKQILNIFDRFAIGKNSLEYKSLIQEYEYVLVQQFEYVNFYSKLCGRGLPSPQSIIEVIDYYRNMVDNNLEYQIKTLVLDENISNPEYYNKVIEYSNMYNDSTVCKNLTAKAYVQLGRIAEQENNVQAAFELYKQAINYNKELPEIYNKLGYLHVREENYHLAIECFKIIDNTYEITACFEAWIKSEPKNADIRLKQGNFFDSIGLYESAKASYTNASGLTQDKAVKEIALSKFNAVMKNKPELIEKYTDIIESENYYHFDHVDEQFLSLIGQSTNSDSSSIFN